MFHLNPGISAAPKLSDQRNIMHEQLEKTRSHFTLFYKNLLMPYNDYINFFRFRRRMSSVSHRLGNSEGSSSGSGSSSASKATEKMPRLITVIRGDQNYNYYVENNPWKLPLDNSVRKIYRFCFVCAHNRFSDEEWKKHLDATTVSNAGGATICTKEGCKRAFDYFPTPLTDSLLKYRGITPRKAQELAHLDRVKSPINITDEKSDRVYKNEQDIPKEYQDVIFALEEYPVGKRIVHINAEIIREQTQVAPEEDSEKKQRYIQFLNEYRDKCLKLHLK